MWAGESRSSGGHCRNYEIPFSFLVSNPARELERYVREMGFRGLRPYSIYQGF
jgi:hypothetical protein